MKRGGCIRIAKLRLQVIAGQFGRMSAVQHRCQCVKEKSVSVMSGTLEIGDDRQRHKRQMQFLQC